MVNSCMLLTFVIVLAVVTQCLQHGGAVRPIPAGLAAARPDPVLASSVAGPAVLAVSWAA